MGTSVSQPSPRTTSWRSVSACYQSEQVTPGRAATEVWRAATAPESTISNQVASDGVFACFELAQRGISPERVQAALNEVSDRHGNSMVLEFAKRATVIAANTPHGGNTWPQQFFKQVTGYL